MFTQEFTKAGLLTRVTVSHERVGWQLREEREGAEISRVHFTDWHRVERALQSIEARQSDEPELLPAIR